jgi:hypothetical protein
MARDPLTTTLAKLGYMTRCFETRIRIAKAIAVLPPLSWCTRALQSIVSSST